MIFHSNSDLSSEGSEFYVKSQKNLEDADNEIDQPSIILEINKTQIYFMGKLCTLTSVKNVTQAIKYENE